MSILRFIVIALISVSAIADPEIDPQEKTKFLKENENLIKATSFINNISWTIKLCATKFDVNTINYKKARDLFDSRMKKLEGHYRSEVALAVLHSLKEEMNSPKHKPDISKRTEEQCDTYLEKVAKANLPTPVQEAIDGTL